MMLGGFGILWAVYVRLWQLFIWNSCGDAISSAIEQGYQISTNPFVPAIGIQQGEHELIWKGGLFGERMQCPDGTSQWLVTNEEVHQMLTQVL